MEFSDMKIYLRVCLSWFVITLLLIGLVACSFPSPPNNVVIPPTQPPVSQDLALGFSPLNQSGVDPVYSLTAQVPLLTGSNDPRVVQFNQQMDALVQQEVLNFKQSLIGLPDPPIAMGSSFDLKYSLVSPWSDIISLKFDIYSYYDGAAHPGQISRAYTFDLATGYQVNLEQLFLPGTNYLQVLADICKTELAERDIAFDASVTGADPLPDNYHNWNISAAGLVITFDPYQVAAYAAGPQVVTIPYAALSTIIDPQGPLAYLLP
jgi:hypothetical protein